MLDSSAREGIPLGIGDTNQNSIRLMVSDISCTLCNTFVTNYTSTGSSMLDMKVEDWIPMIAKAGCDSDEIRYLEIGKVVRHL